MVGGSFRVLWLPPPLKLVAMISDIAEILLNVALNTKIQIHVVHVPCYSIPFRTNIILWIHVLKIDYFHISEWEDTVHILLDF